MSLEQFMTTNNTDATGQKSQFLKIQNTLWKGLLCLLLLCLPAKAFYMESALPLYIYPRTDDPNWNRMFSAGGSKVGFVVANVYNGPGAAVDSNWTRVINNSVANGIRVYGYVYTQYGARSAAEVEADIQKWLVLYPQVSGFFVDETSTALDKLSYYGSRYNFIKSINPDFTVVINPGTITPEDYMAVCDVNTIFESPLESWATKTFPAWMANYPEDRFYAVVYNTPSEAQMYSVVERAAQLNIGKVFVTDKLSPSGALPAYFENELGAIIQYRSEPTPIALAIGNVGSSVTRNSASVSWQTTIPAVGAVVYGTSPNALNLQVQQPTVATSHWVNIANLARKTVYYYQIVAQSADGGSTVSSPVYSFKTKP
jgi:hypothetical protein